MARRRFAGGFLGGLAVTRIERVAIAAAALAAAASLGGCASAPPFSVEERLWFDKATGSDITGVPPGLRTHQGIGYPVHGAYRRPPPQMEEP